MELPKLERGAVFSRVWRTCLNP